jgi:hypothetical protein
LLVSKEHASITFVATWPASRAFDTYPNAYTGSDTYPNAHAGGDADTYTDTGRDSNAHPLSDTRYGDKSCRDRELIHADFSEMD